MRDYFITIVVFSALFMVFRHPHYGIYLWSWLAYMNPHRQAWGFAYDMPFALITAVVTVAAYFISREPKRLNWSLEIGVWLLFLSWLLLTNFFAFFPDRAWILWDKVWKIQLMTFLTMMLITNPERLKGLIWVIVVSLGYYGVKGGLFTILHGGSFIVWGPSGTFIEGNNELALALIMIIPLIRYLHLQEKRIWVRHGLAIAMLLCAVSAIGSQSRGAFLAILSMGLYMWLKSRQKLMTGALAIAAIALVLMIMPSEWYERMDTIQTYQQDSSAMGRINAWHAAYNVAVDRITGGGFDMFQPPVFMRYAPDPYNVHDAHSIYFQLLGNHGFVGLGLWLLLGMLVWLKAGKVVRTFRNDASMKWATDLAGMLQVSMVGYLTGGAFLGLAYFDLYYHILCMLLLTYQFTFKTLAGENLASRNDPVLRPLPHPSSRW